MKAALPDASLLMHSTPGALVILMIDASNVAVGMVLQQQLAVITWQIALMQYLLPFEYCTRIHMTANHQATNGVVERFDHRLKTFLRAADDPENWTDHLSLALLDIRFDVKSTFACSTTEIVFSNTVRILGELILPTFCIAVENAVADRQHC
ncbi:unnamed protein product [Schistocephalus solidus]|uniref:Integrase catalytic domain-containing protein n=1 Tax=Schistocephalus solidus TaxID=70667 RepID=A0A183SYF3_SCHSO|nr:unnamed protein product [Schistocephalus solidus]